MTYINHLHGMVVEADSDTSAASETRERSEVRRRGHKRSWPFTHPGQAPLSSSRPKYEDNNNGLTQRQLAQDTETFYKTAAEVKLLKLNQIWIENSFCRIMKTIMMNHIQQKQSSSTLLTLNIGHRREADR